MSKSTDNRMEAFEAFANCIGLSSVLISDGALEIGGTRKQPWRFMWHTKFHATKHAYQSSKVETAIRIIMTCTKCLIPQRNVPKRLWDYDYQYESTFLYRVRQPKWKEHLRNRCSGRLRILPNIWILFWILWFGYWSIADKATRIWRWLGVSKDKGGHLSY